MAYIDFRSWGFSTQEATSLTVYRGLARFTLGASIADVQGTTFGIQLQQQTKKKLRSKWGDTSVVDPAKLAYERCLPVLEQLAPRTELEDLRLEAFLHAPTWKLRLEKAGGSEEVAVHGQDQCAFTPNFAIEPMRTDELPESCRTLPQFPADDIFIAPADIERSLSSVQGRVRTRDGALMWLKPRLEGREPDFERELTLLSKIKSAGLAPRLRVPELFGVVVSGQGEWTVGMLMTLIVSPETGTHLESPFFHDKLVLHAKWEEQVSNTVRELHAHGIVWGDVNPMNIAIDEELNAWVIDFGGMNNVQFVDDANRETEKGDWQGVRRLFGEWLPQQVGRDEGG